MMYMPTSLDASFTQKLKDGASVSGSGVTENYVIAVEITMISFFVAKL